MASTVAATYVQRLHQSTPTRLWVNNPSGAEAQRALALGAIACTTNPGYAARMLSTLDAGDRAILLAQAQQGAVDTDAAVSRVQAELVARLLPVVARAQDPQEPFSGLVSIQGNPHRDTDSAHILHEAEAHAQLGPTIILKIPVTRAGLVAIEDLLRRGLPVLATEMMSVAQTRALCDCYRRAVAQRRPGAPPPRLIATHITGIFDEYLQQRAAQDAPDLPADVVAEAGLLVAQRVHAELTRQGLPIALMGGGARARRHVTDMVGGRMQVTINPDAIDGLVSDDPPLVERFQVPGRPEHIARLHQRLPDFRQAWDETGLAIGDFETFGPVRFFLSMFSRGWDTVRAQIARPHQASA